MFTEIGNSLDKLRHPRSDAYSAEQVLLNEQEIQCGGAYPDCYPEILLQLRRDFDRSRFGLVRFGVNVRFRVPYLHHTSSTMHATTNTRLEFRARVKVRVGVMVRVRVSR